MQAIMSFIGVHVVSQLLLLVLYYFGQPFFNAIYELYSWSPSLVYFYLAGSLAIFYVLMSLIRQKVLFAGVGKKASRAARLRGYKIR